jgi:hypothetical protein
MDVTPGSGGVVSQFVANDPLRFVDAVEALQIAGTLIAVLSEPAIRSLREVSSAGLSSLTQMVPGK